MLFRVSGLAGASGEPCRPQEIPDEGEIEVYDIPFGDRNIWGATAGMLMTLYRLVRT